MQYTTLGITGTQISKIGLGMAALGRPGYINLGHAEDLNQQYDAADMQARAFNVLDCAWDAGIRYFDAARSYGRGEEFLGNWLRDRQIPTEDVVIGSKWGYTYAANWKIDAEKHEVKEHTLPVLRRQIKESRSHLGSYLRLYQIHSATLDSGVLDNEEVLDELARLRDDGLVVGLSLSGAQQAEVLRKAMTIERSGRCLFGAVQATWNLLERSAEEALNEAKSAGMGIIIKEALANGRLTDRNHDPVFHKKRTLLDDVARSQQTTIDAVALATVLAQPWVDIVLSGAAVDAHLQSNLKALDVRWDAEIAERLHALRETAEEYWEIRSGLRWN